MGGKRGVVELREGKVGIVLVVGGVLGGGEDGVERVAGAGLRGGDGGGGWVGGWSYSLAGAGGGRHSGGFCWGFFSARRGVVFVVVPPLFSPLERTAKGLVVGLDVILGDCASDDNRGVLTRREQLENCG